MELANKLEIVKAMTEENDDSVIEIYLNVAERKIIEKAFPFDPEAEMPTRYEFLQCEICAYLLNKRGAEGQTEHNENGIDRTYESASVPDSMLKAVVPYSKALGVD